MFWKLLKTLFILTIGVLIGVYFTTFECFEEEEKK